MTNPLHFDAGSMSAVGLLLAAQQIVQRLVASCAVLLTFDLRGVTIVK